MPNQSVSVEHQTVNDKLQTLFYQVFGINYTLKELSLMPFEEWARLIEIENITNNG